MNLEAMDSELLMTLFFSNQSRVETQNKVKIRNIMICRLKSSDLIVMTQRRD